MKKYILSILILAGVAAILFSSCYRDDSPPTYRYDYIVERYMIPESIKRSVGFSPNIYFSMSIDGDISGNFKELNAFYKDTGFNRELEGAYTALYKPVESITIVCDKDYDAEHPAGTPLDDITLFTGKSAYLAIQLGYDESKFPDVPTRLYPPKELYPIEKILSELTKDELTLLYPEDFSLWIKEQPAESGDYKFTVTFTMEDGQTLSLTMDEKIEVNQETL